MGRLEANIDWYDRKAKANQRAYKTVQDFDHRARHPHSRARGIWLHPRHASTRAAFLVGAAAGVIVLLEDSRRSTNGRRARSSTARPARACATSSISSPRGPARTRASSLRRRKRLLAERTSSLVMAEHSKWTHDARRQDRDVDGRLGCAPRLEGLGTDGSSRCGHAAGNKRYILRYVRNEYYLYDISYS